jgi:GT2 family glycosyltransferase
LNKEGNIFFSVVIPTYERPDDLKVCLQSLSEKIQRGTPPYEIIVSDDSKSDNSKILVEKEFFNVSWGKGKHNGPAGNRNAGVDRAKGKWIIFLDDDCIAQEGFIKAYSNAIASNPDVDVLEGRIFPDRRRRTWAEGCPANEHGGLYWTSNLCVRKSLFLELEGLDERFEVAYEDVDFAYRAKLAGTKFLFVREAQVCHPWRSVRQGGKNWKSKNYESADFVRFLKKHNPSEPEFSFSRYSRNLIRMATSDFMTCIWVYRMRGLDILLFQMLVTFKSMFDIFIHNRK